MDPKCWRAHANLGNQFAKEGKVDEAILEFRKAIELNPKYAAAHNLFGNELAKKGKFDEAIAEYRKAIELKPDYAHAHNNLAIALRKKGNVDEAILKYRKAIELQPDFASFYSNLGVVLAKKGNVDEAILEFRKAIELNPKDVAAHYNLGKALGMTGNVDEAILEFRKAIELDPKEVKAHYNLGIELGKKGKVDEAIAEYRKAIELGANIERGNVDARLADLLLKLGDHAQAANVVEQARQREWMDPVVAASWLAACAAIAEKDGSLSESQRQVAAQGYTHRISELNELARPLLDPPYAPAGELICLDLQPQANVKLTESFHAGEKQNNLAVLPRGEQMFGGVRFRIGDGLIQLAGKHLPQRPGKVAGIRVNKTFAKLYIFHATGWEAPDGTPIGRYDVHYEDQTTATIPIVYGEDVRGWWSHPMDTQAVARGRVGWVGANPDSRRGNSSLRLYVSRWGNPHPEKKVIGIDYVSTNTDAAPFCVAMTVEQPAGPMAEKTQAADLPGIEEQ